MRKRQSLVTLLTCLKRDKLAGRTWKIFIAGMKDRLWSYGVHLLEVVKGALFKVVLRFLSVRLVGIS